MTIERIACLCLCIFITPAVAAGQQRSEMTDQGVQAPVRTVIERNHSGGDAASWRTVEIRNESGGREIVVETSEMPDIEGRLAPFQEIVEETNRTPNSAQTRRDVFGFAGDHRRRLLVRTESLRESLANGDSNAIHNTWAPDSNGHLGLMSRETEQTRTTAADVRRTDTTFLVPGINETLRETERTEQTERRVTPGVVQHDSTHLVRDLNGRWQPTEKRRGEALEAGASEGTEEETIERLDVNGRVAIESRKVTHRSRANGQEYVVIETYAHAPYADGFSRSGSSLALNERVRRTTTVAADGNRHTVEEVESRSLVAPSDPMRLTRRTVTTVRQIGADRRVTERQVFERDVNGQLRLVFNDIEDRAAR